MKSPFPGMDPYLEDPAFWWDFHLTFIGCWREAIANVLPPPYEARFDETVHFVQMSAEVIQLIYPDVTVSRARQRARSRRRGGGTAVLKPTVIPHQPLQKVRQARIEILHRPDRSLVTVLEMLSPTIKVGDGFAEFCRKRQAVLRQRTHLVELDLLLGGRRLPLSEPLPAGDYYVLVSRADRRPDCEVYAWFLRQLMLTIPIPLRPEDGDVPVNLQAVLRRAYRRGRYAGSLRYGKPPLAPLALKDKRWAIEQKP
jgi:hypothetical protein